MSGLFVELKNYYADLLVDLRRESLEFLIGLRSLILLAMLFVTTLILVVGYILLLLVFPADRLWRWYIRPCAWLCLRVAGQKVRIIGQAPLKENGPYLYLLNHESWLDTFLLSYAIGHRVNPLCADSYFKIPIWGLMMRLHGVIPVNRYNHAEAINQMKEVEAAIAAGESVVICPEGERSRNGEIQQFKNGAFHLANNTKVMIVPCAVGGTFRAWPRGSLKITPGTVYFRFLEPIPYEAYQPEYEGTNVIGISALVRSQIFEGTLDILYESREK